MNRSPAVERMRSGITGLDEALGGGLPRGRTTLVVGGTGAGKTIFAIQTLAQGVLMGEPGVLVTFEESPKDLLANMAAFTWAPSGRAATRLCVMDGRELRTASRNGTFDLVGLLSAIEHRCRRIKCRRIAFDGLDVLLDMIDDPALMRREVYRLADWLSQQSLTAIITAKRQPDEEALPSRYDFLPFLTDCVILLQHRIVGRTATRALRVLKCRGVGHSSNEMPLVLTSSGIEIDAPRTKEMEHRVFTERISSGVARLDTMLDSGYLRGTCTLVSGAPGTSKTSLAGAFAEAACARGERTLFVSFDEAGEAITRNLASVNIRLARFVRSGMLRMFSVAASGTTPEAHALRIGSLLTEHEARCLVIDPASAIIPAAVNATEFAADAVLGLLDLAKRRGITVLLTSLLDGSDPTEEKTAIAISTIADTWIHLSYVAAAGERNRALTIVKSRGTGHANQVRELILSSQGLSLVDVYTGGGAVLMGTLRRQKEEQERAEKTRLARAEQTRHEEIGSSIAETQVRVASLRADVGRKKAELRFLKESSHAGAAMGAANLAVLRRLRGADPAPKKSRRSSIRPALRRSR
jgi:circadian clock protein KaiC